MSVSLVAMICVKFFTSIAWTWYVLMGTAVCFGVGYAVSALGRQPAIAVARAEEPASSK
jgi:hypothetical protein